MSNTYLAFMHAHNNVRIVPSELKSLYKGENYDFSKQHVQIDPNLEDKDWIKKQQDISTQEQTQQIHVFNKTKKPYCIEDIGENEEQKQITYAILHKLQEWLFFPERHKQDSTIQFQPLFLTVRGEGGTGKSHIIKILTNIIQDMFDVNVLGVVAPTGNAAFNVGGKTCHSFFKIFPDNQSTFSPESRKKLLETLKRQLLIFIDERSLLSCDVLGAIEKNCCSAAHGGCNGHKLPFGGIPIIVLFGDDMQLPSVVQWGVGYGASHVINENGRIKNVMKSPIAKKGARAFLTLSSNVITLKKNCRIEASEYKLQKYCSSVRTKGGLTETDAKELLKYHISSPELSQTRRQFLFDKAMWIYTTNAEVTEHNQSMLRTLVNEDNPLMSFCKKYQKRAKGKSHFDSKKTKDASVFLCRGCRVSVSKNLWQEVGLYNGATGTVVDIRMSPGSTPLQGDLPAYVIVDMDTYNGPVWDQDNPSYVPIPLSRKFCGKDDNCCIFEYIPLQLAFARTLHKFQGQTVGPGHNNQCMVFNPGTPRFEGSNPGLFYVGLSRVTTLGSSINDSSFYLAGPHADLDRLTDQIHFRCSKNREYARVSQRSKWIHYLDKKEHNTHIEYSSQQNADLLLWLQAKPHYSNYDLDSIIHYHNKHRH